MKYANRWEQAVDGLEIKRDGGVVRVDDGQDRWLCLQEAWQETREALLAQAPYEDEQGGTWLAYGNLCSGVADPVISRIGSDRGTEKQLEALAVAALAVELMTEEEAADYGWVSPVVDVVEVLHCQDTPWEIRHTPGTLDGPWGETAEEVLANLEADDVKVLDWWDRRQDGKGFWVSVRCLEHEACEHCNPTTGNAEE